MNTVSRLLTGLLLVVSSFFLFSTSAPAADLTYSGDTVTMTGEINPSDYATKFVPFMTDHLGEVRFFILKDSPGGSFYDSIMMGIYIRNAGLSTVVSGYCYSGCAFMWLAGEHLMVDVGPVPNFIGLHMPYSTTWAGFTVQANGYAVEMVRNYLEEVGLNERAIKEVLATPGGPKSVLMITGNKVHEWNLKILPYGR